MHHASVTNNYAWLPHNVDSSIETPEEFEGMPVQPLGDKQSLYNKTVQGCVDHYGELGYRCLETEVDRIEMSLRQPKVRTGSRVFVLSIQANARHIVDCCTERL